MTRRVSECGRTLRPQPWPQGFYQSVHAATIGLWLNLTHSGASSSNTSPASRHGLGPGLPALTDYSSMSPCWTRGSVVTQARRAKPASPQTGFPDLYAVLYFRVLSFSPRRLDPNPSPNPNLKCCFVSLKKRITFDECQLKFLASLGSQAGVRFGWFGAGGLPPSALVSSVFAGVQRTGFTVQSLVVVSVYNHFMWLYLCKRDMLLVISHVFFFRFH